MYVTNNVHLVGTINSLQSLFMNKKFVLRTVTETFFSQKYE
jgi:hypothetical protein